MDEYKQGTIEKFMSERGFGFIKSDDDNQYFFHFKFFKERVDTSTIEIGQKVYFRTEIGSIGKEVAKDITFIN